MSIEVLAEDIFSLAKQEADAIVQETQEAIAKLKQDSEKEQGDFKNSLQKQYDEELEGLQAQLHSHYERESYRIILEAKSEVLQTLYNETLNQLKTLDEKKKTSLFKHMIEQASQELDVAFLRVSKQDEKLVSSLVSKDVQVKADSKVQGLLFETKDHKQILDYSYKMLLDDFFAEYEEELQQKLFN